MIGLMLCDPSQGISTGGRVGTSVVLRSVLPTANTLRIQNDSCRKDLLRFCYPLAANCRGSVRAICLRSSRSS